MVEPPGPRESQGEAVTQDRQMIGDDTEALGSGLNDATRDTWRVRRRLQRCRHATNNSRVVAAVTRLPYQPCDHDQDVTTRPTSVAARQDATHRPP